MTITEKDFILEDEKIDSSRYNLTFMKRVKKKDTGKFEIEPGDTLYGLTLATALERIAKHRTAKKFADSLIDLKTFLREYQKDFKEIVKLCHESLPEKFDTGE